MERGRNGVIRAGTSFGIAGAVLGFCTFAVETLARLLGGAFEFLAAFAWVAVVGALALLIWAGVAPARASGRAASGAGAGALVGACTGVGAVIGDVLDGLQNGTIPAPADALGALGYGINVLIIMAGAAALFACLGTGLGALGGLIGRGRAMPREPLPPTYPPTAGTPPSAGDNAYPPPPAYPLATVRPATVRPADPDC